MFASRPFGPYLAYLDLTFADLEPVWGHLGARLGYLGPISAPSWASVAPLLGYLGQSWGCLGVMLGHLQLIWKASWAILCHLRAPFHLNQRFWTHLEPPWSPLGPILAHVGPNWGPFRSLFHITLGLSREIFFAQSSNTRWIAILLSADGDPQGKGGTPNTNQDA